MPKAHSTQMQYSMYTQIYTCTITMLMIIRAACAAHRTSATESICHVVDRHGQEQNAQPYEAKSKMEAKQEAAELDPKQKAKREPQHTERAEFGKWWSV